MIEIGLKFLAIWTLLSIPIGILVGRLLARRAEEATNIYPDVTKPRVIGSPSFANADFNASHVTPIISGHTYPADANAAYVTPVILNRNY